MRWRNDRQSDNVEDQRGVSGRTIAGGGVGTLIIVILALLFGVNPSTILRQFANSPTAVSQSAPVNPANDEMKQFVAVVLADTEDVWHSLFQQMGRTYRNPHLVLFSDRVQSACGVAGSSVGPFYCPADEKVYLDLQFFEELKTRFGAPGDFAQAYVIAHEVGHHVQNLLGTSANIERLEEQSDETTANRYSVMLELQADCYAGVWAKQTDNTQHFLEPGDIEEAMNAASQIGDDTLQRESQGYVVPDSFTHGTSAQRMKWFNAGFTGGDISSCDTFNAAVL